MLEEEDSQPAASKLSARFSELVSLAGGPTKVARELGASRTTVDKWAAGGSRIPFEAAVKVTAMAGRSLDWLAGVSVGDGSSDEKTALPKEIPGSDDQKAFVAALVAKGYLRPVETNDAVPDGFVAVPMLDVQASAGGGHLPPSEEIHLRGVAAFRADWLRARGVNPDRAHVLTAVGDSMEPTIRDGDFLLVDRSIERIIDNGIYIVVLAGLVLVKRAQIRFNGALVLKSENPVYGEEVVPPDSVNDVVVEGRVRWYGRGI